MATRRVRAARWGLVAAWAGFIWVLSSMPDLSSGLAQDFVLRKLGHTVVFGVLALLLWRALPAKLSNLALRAGYAGVLALAYALADELHQSFVAGRHGSATDVLIDGVGIAVGVGLALLWQSRRTTRRATSASASS